MSRGFSLTTIVGALEATGEFIGGPPNWEALTPEQKELLVCYAVYRDNLPYIPSLESWARRTATEINAILAERGFDIRLDEWPDDGQSFGTLSINDVTVLWQEAGVLAEPINGRPAFTLDRATIAYTELFAGHDNPVLRLRAQGGEVVCITIHNEPSGPFELVEAVQHFRSAMPVGRRLFDKVRLPMVHFKQMVDLGWLVGLGTHSPTGWWQVVQALQEVRFGMNQFGARAKEATAVTVTRSPAPAPTIYVVDRPFLIWFERPGISVPTFQAYVTEDDWNDPGDLSAL